MTQKQKINTIMENKEIKDILAMSYEDFYHKKMDTLKKVREI